MSRLLAGTVLALSLFAGVSAADEAPVELAEAMPVSEVTVFKNGHAFVLHRGRLAVDAGGDVLTDTVPAPVLAKRMLLLS